MADPPPYRDSIGDTADDTHLRLDRGSPPSAPRWVKVFGIIALVLVLLFVIQHFAGNILGGGGLHTPR